MTEEIEPFIIVRAGDDGSSNGEVAIWRLTDGQQAVALFLEEATAQAYSNSAELDESWTIRHPTKEALQDLFQVAVNGGVHFAVLDPSAEAARRIWDLRQLVK